jgi:hypothetical protein
VFLPLPVVLVSTMFITQVAEQVPKFDLRSICEGNEGCLRGEAAARNQLAEQWAQFAAAERDRCVRLTTSSRMPSYVQVMTCLEMARSARQSSEEQASRSQPKKKPKRP